MEEDIVKKSLPKVIPSVTKIQPLIKPYDPIAEAKKLADGNFYNLNLIFIIIYFIYVLFLINYSCCIK
jgi:hypothetical protein